VATLVISIVSPVMLVVTLVISIIPLVILVITLVILLVTLWSYYRIVPLVMQAVSLVMSILPMDIHTNGTVIPVKTAVILVRLLETLVKKRHPGLLLFSFIKVLISATPLAALITLVGTLVIL
jgi:lysylphosphatidylglycerol synthetase-like protein (DUF2156 family)